MFEGELTNTCCGRDDDDIDDDDEAFPVFPTHGSVRRGNRTYIDIRYRRGSGKVRTVRAKNCWKTLTPHTPFRSRFRSASSARYSTRSPEISPAVEQLGELIGVARKASFGFAPEKLKPSMEKGTYM